MPDPACETLPWESLGQPLSPLFLDYLAGRASVAPFLGADGFDLDAIARAGDKAAAVVRPRDAAAGALVRQQEDRGAALAARRARELAGEDALAIVTGQQPGLFGGPRFVLLKALATIELAGRLESRRGKPVVPVFWVAADDHDFAEVRQVSLLDANGAIRTLRYQPRSEPIGTPASLIVLDDTMPALVEDLAHTLPSGLGRDEVLEAVSACYVPGETLSGAFARLISRLLPELVVLDGSDAALKALAVPVFVREVREGSPVSRLALEVGERLLAAGYHQQVPVRPGFLNLFTLAEGQRRALAFANRTVEVRGTGLKLPFDEAVRRIEEAPGTWSAGALLRPLVQDWLLPTAAYVGGPAEIAYHAQIAPSYSRFGIPRPVAFPRPSATLVEPPQARALEAERLGLADLVGDPEALVTQWAREAYPDLESGFTRARETIEQELGAIGDALAGHDPTLRAAATSAAGRALHQLEGLHEKALRALKKRDQGRAERLRRTRDALLPGGALQERGLGLVGPLARHGAALVETLRQRLDLFARGHQVIRL